MSGIRKLDALQARLATLKGDIDVGMDDAHIITVDVSVTPAYAAWLSTRKVRKKSGTNDVIVMGPESGAFSSHGPAKFPVQTLIYMSLGIVRNLLVAGVPEDVALGLLPHELYVLLKTDKPEPRMQAAPGVKE